MRISDWSSDVCSSDLVLGAPRQPGAGVGRILGPALRLGEVVRVAPVGDGRGDVARRGLVDADHGEQSREQVDVGGVEVDLARFVDHLDAHAHVAERSEEHTSEIQSLMSTSYAVFCLKKK